MKKRAGRRGGLKEGDPGYLQSASETDSALEDSESEAESEDDNDTGSWKSIVDTVQSDPALKPALLWLKTCLQNEKEDRENDQDVEDVPLGTWPMSSLHNVNKQLSLFKNVNKQLLFFPKCKQTADMGHVPVSRKMVWN